MTSARNRKGYHFDDEAILASDVVEPNRCHSLGWPQWGAVCLRQRDHEIGTFDSPDTLGIAKCGRFVMLGMDGSRTHAPEVGSFVILVR